MSLIILLVVILNVKSGEGQIRILREPEDYNRNQADFRSLICSVSGPSNMKYEWYHNSTLIDENYFLKFLSFDTGVLVVDKDDVDLSYQGIYQLFVSSSFGKIFGRTIRVKFKVAGKFEPRDTTEIHGVIIGQPYRLDCPKHSYSSGCSYNWGTSSGHSGLRHIKKYNNRVLLQNGTLFFSAVQERDIQEFNKGYSCILDCVWPSLHSSTRSHSISLKATKVDKSSFGPKIETNLEDREVLVGHEFVIFTCAASGSPTPSYRWVKITEINNTEDIYNTKDIELGPFNHRLTIRNISKIHNVTYKCIAATNNENETKVDMVQGRIIVREKPKWFPHGKITNKFADVFTNITWECKAYGDPKPVITWYANGTKLSSKIGRCEISDGRLTFSRLLVEDTGMYECVAENGFGYIYQIAALHVKAKKPAFTNKNTSTVLLMDNEEVIECRSNGIPLANNTWTKDGEEITFPKSNKYSIHENQDLVIHKVANEDAGVYVCTARNVFGEDKRTIDVDIGDITFLLTPQSYQNISQGTTFSLQCKAKSTFKLKYKWRFDGNDLIYDNRHIWSLDANMLVVQNASQPDSGKYECVAYIDDPAKLEYSRSADVIIEGPPRIPKGFHLQQNCTNSTAILAWQPLPIYNKSETYVVIEWRITYGPPGFWYRLPKQINAILGKTEVKNLISWAKIQFRAIALNKFGFAKPSEETRFKNCETPPSPPEKCPENVHGVPGPQDILRINWNRMTVVDYNGPGFNYTIKFRRSNSSSWEQKVLNRLQDQFNISNAGINQLWHFKIRAQNSEGPGPLCQEVTFYSGQSSKSKPGVISNLIIKDIETTSALVTWVPPPLEQDGSIAGYKLEYWSHDFTVKRKRRQLTRDICLENENPCKVVLLDRMSADYRLTNLSMMTRYNLSLRAFNNAGEGPRQYSMFETTVPTTEKLTSSVYNGEWFITIVSVTCFLILVVLILILLRKRSEKYPVRKREQQKGGFRNLEEDVYDPGQTSNLPDSSIQPPLHSIYSSNPSNMDEDLDGLSLALSTEDKYDDGGSFIGEYSDVRPFRKYEENFV